MGREERGPVSVGGLARSAALALLLVAGLYGLRHADPVEVAPVAVAVALAAGWSGGRLARGLGLPPVLGYLVVGTLVGPAAGGLVAWVWPDWPFPDGLIPPQAFRAASIPGAVALGLAMTWVGRQLDVRRLEGARRAVGGMFLGHVVASLLVTLLVAWAITSGPLASGGDALLEDAPSDLPGFMVALLGTSALLVGAVVHGVRGVGPVARTTLWLAVLGEVSSLLFLGVWTAASGRWDALLIDHPGRPGLQLFTVILGVIVGLIMASGQRWSPSGRGPWVVAVGVLASAAASGVGLSAALVGLAAGVTLAHTSDRDETSDALVLAAGVAFLVLFTLAGARLPIVPLLRFLPLALLLALVRGVLLFGAAIGMARVLRAAPLPVRYGWTGLVASAVPAAGLVGWRTLDPAMLEGGASAFVWALAAVDGLLGALAVSVALDLAQETPAARARLADEPDAGCDLQRIDVDLVPDEGLREHLAELQDDLRGVVREATVGPLAHESELWSSYLDALRREHRRHQRRVTALVHGAPGELAEGLRLARVELAERWRSHVFDHAARMNRRAWQPTELVSMLDRAVAAAPEEVSAPARPRSDTPWGEAFRVFTGWLVGAGPRRTVPWQDLVRFHLSGRAPARLEPFAAAIVNGELALERRSRGLFLHILDAWSEAEDRVLSDDDLRAIGDAVADEFRWAQEELDALSADAARRLEAVLSRTVEDVAEDVVRVGGFEVPARSRAFARAEAARQEGLHRLGEAYEASREGARLRFAALSLELELVGLELEVQGVLGEQGSHLARMVRGRGATQVSRVLEAMDEALERLDEALSDDDMDGATVAQMLRDEVEAFARVTEDAADQVDELRADLAGDEAIAPLLDTLVKAGHALTDRYEVPDGSSLGGAWTLPEGPDAVEVPFREIVLGALEDSITRDLLDLTHSYATRMEEVLEVLDDTERVVAFNVELAAGELGSAGDGPLSREVRESVAGILRDGLERHREELSEAERETRDWYEAIEARVHHAVLDELHTLRVHLADGRFASLERHRPAAVPDVARTGDLVDLDALGDAFRGWVGPERVAVLRERLGLRELVVGDDDLTPARFAPPTPRVDVPPVYRRLFSAQALEAGELLGGREGQAERVRQALDEGRGARLRAVAVVGPDGAGQPAIIRAALRALRVRGVVRHDLDGPVSADEVARWFDRGAHGHVYVVTGFHWLYSLRAGGFDALRRFVDGVVADEGRNAWIVDASNAVWGFASSAAPLDRAFPTQVRIHPLGADELERAMRARHAMSGFDLLFAEAASSRRPERVEEAWFRAFHEASGGIARDALELWLAAVQEVDLHRERVVMGPVPRVPDRAMHHLTDRTTLALLVGVRQGFLDEDTWVRLFREPAGEARAQLAHLVHWGLLAEDERERLVVPSHLRHVLQDHLRERGWA